MLNHNESSRTRLTQRKFHLLYIKIGEVSHVKFDPCLKVSNEYLRFPRYIISHVLFAWVTQLHWYTEGDSMFKSIFVHENCSVFFIQISLKFDATGPTIFYASIGLDNLSPVRHEAIIWTNDELDYRHINSSLGLSELRRQAVCRNNSAWVLFYSLLRRC